MSDLKFTPDIYYSTINIDIMKFSKNVYCFSLTYKQI